MDNMKGRWPIENFFKIRAEKQEHIINAAFAVFGSNGYKKASVADIADAAGISKGMITYYFGSKKNLYLYLLEFSSKIILNSVQRHFDRSITDFFDKIRIGTQVKVAAVEGHPAIMQFLMKVSTEQDPEVYEEIQSHFSAGMDTRNTILLDDTDLCKFKEGVDIQMIVKTLDWAAKGMMMDLELLENVDKMGELVEEFYKLLEFMRKAFYKEEAV